MAMHVGFPKDKEEMKKKRMEALMRKISDGVKIEERYWVDEVGFEDNVGKNVEKVISHREHVEHVK